METKDHVLNFAFQIHFYILSWRSLASFLPGGKKNVRAANILNCNSSILCLPWFRHHDLVDPFQNLNIQFRQHIGCF